MNILYVLHKNPNISLGGVERHIKDLSTTISLKGFNVYILYPSHSHLELALFKDGGIQLLKMKCASIKNFSKFKDLRDKDIEELFKKILDNYLIDVVHFQHILGLPLSLFEIAKSSGAKVFITIHDYYLWCQNYKLLRRFDGDMRFCYFEDNSDICVDCIRDTFKSIVSREYIKERREYAKKLLNICDCIITPSKYLKGVIINLFNVDEKKIKIIEHGITHPNDLYFRNCKDKNTMNIGYLGAFTFEKGAHIFLRFVDEAKRLGLNRYVSFYIIGELGFDIPNNYCKNNCLKIIGSYKPEDVNRLLNENSIDVVLLLSIWPETYSYTLSEAIANKIPVIATDLGALRQRISEYSSGFLVPYEKPLIYIFDIIQDFLKHPEILDYFSKRCEAVSKVLPDISDMSNRYVGLYKNMHLTKFKN